MAALFEPITIRWKGQPFVIPADRVLRAIAVIESVVTLKELSRGDAVPLAKVAMAYGALLRFAGVTATDDEVYIALFQNEGLGSTSQILTLINLMLPKSVQEAMSKEPPPSKDEDVGADGSGGPAGNVAARMLAS